MHKKTAAMRTPYTKYLLFFVIIFAHSGCFNLTKISRESLALLKKETDTYQKLQDLSAKIEASEPQTQRHWELLKTSAHEFQNYLDLLASLDNTLTEFESKDPLQMRKIIEKSLTEEQHIELAKTWGDKHRPLIENLISRTGELKIYLASWDFKKTSKLTRDISILLQNENSFSLVFPEKTSIVRAKDINTLLAVFYKLSETPKITSNFTISTLEDTHYNNTTEECIHLVQKLSDPDCIADASASCGGQMNLKCIQDVTNKYKSKHCRSRKTSSKEKDGDYLTSTTFVENEISSELKQSISSCESLSPLF